MTTTTRQLVPGASRTRRFTRTRLASPAGRDRASRRRLRSAVRAAVPSAALGLAVASGWPMAMGPTLLLGGAIILWMVGSFALERPDDE